MVRSSTLRCALPAGSLFTAPAPAQAQEGAVEEVTVTGKFQNSVANRLPIAPVDLPFSLQVIDRSVIEQRAFLNPLEIIETLPNVVRRQTQLLPTGGSYNIRGLFATVLTNNRPENDSRGAGRRDTSQIESIEVTKGPASILTGPVIPGGVINQITKSPQSDDFLRVSGRAGSYNTYRAEADGNMGALLGSPIFSGRMTIVVEQQGSAQKPEENQHLLSAPRHRGQLHRPHPGSGLDRLYQPQGLARLDLSGQFRRYDAVGVR